MEKDIYKVKEIDQKTDKVVDVYNMKRGDLVFRPKHSCYNCKNLYTFKSSEELPINEVLRCKENGNTKSQNIRIVNNCEFFELYVGGELDYSILK